MKPTVPFLVGLEKGRFREAYTNEQPAPGQRLPFVLSEPNDNPLAPYRDYFTDPARLTYNADAIQTVNLGVGYVCSPDGIVIYKGKLVRETLARVASWRQDSCVAATRPGRQIVFRDNLKLATRVTRGSFFVGIQAAWRNYSLWMREVVPRLVTYLQMRMSRPNLKLILPIFDPDSFQGRTLQLLGIDEKSIHRIESGGFEGFENLHVVFGLDPFNISPLAAHSGWLLGAAYAATVPRTNESRPERIYIHRRSDVVRRVSNFNEIMPVLAEFGFQVVEFEDVPLFEQIATMRAAKVVIAEHGAGAANCMFCPPGAVLIELFNPTCQQPAHWTLASRCGVRYGFMVGTHDGGPDGRARLDWNSDYTIDPARLRHNLAQLTG